MQTEPPRALNQRNTILGAEHEVVMEAEIGERHKGYASGTPAGVRFQMAPLAGGGASAPPPANGWQASGLLLEFLQFCARKSSMLA